jgi:hypothetical protein
MALVLFSFKAKQSWLVIMLPVVCLFHLLLYRDLQYIFLGYDSKNEFRGVMTLNYLLLYLDGLATLHSQ